MIAGAVVNAHAVLDDNVIVNSSALIGYDYMIGNYVHIAPGVKLASSVHVGDGSYIGLGPCVIQRQKIGKKVFVGAGTVVSQDVQDGVTVVGNPQRIIDWKCTRHD